MEIMGFAQEPLTMIEQGTGRRRGVLSWNQQSLVVSVYDCASNHDNVCLFLSLGLLALSQLH